MVGTAVQPCGLGGCGGRVGAPRRSRPRSQASFFFSSRTRHTRFWRGWSSDVCSSDLAVIAGPKTAKGTAKVNIVNSGATAITKRAVPVTLYLSDNATKEPTDVALATQNKPLSLKTDRKSVVQGKSVDLGGRRIIKKTK